MGIGICMENGICIGIGKGICISIVICIDICKGIGIGRWYLYR